MDQEELNQVMQIATNYFRSQTSSEKEVERLLQSLAAVVQQEGVKLVHLEDYLFLVVVRGKGLVEVHTIGDQNNPRSLVKNFKTLLDYLKNIDVKVVYSYSPDQKFVRIANMISPKMQQYESIIDGKKMYVFVVEL
jgi:hypothetical protein